MCTKQVQDALIANQFISDSLALVLFLIFYDANEFNSNLIGHYTICCAAAYTSHFMSFIFSLCISVLSLLYIFNQCIAICFPFFAARHITIHRASIAIGGVWSLAMIFAIIPGIMLSNYFIKGKSSTSVSEMRRKAVEICAISLTIFIVMAFLLHCIIYFASLRWINVMYVQRHNKVFCSKRGKTFLACFLLVTSLAVSWLPFTIFHFIDPKLDTDLSVYLECYAIDFLPVLNLFFNSLISLLFKIKFRRLVGCFYRIPTHHVYDRRSRYDRDTAVHHQNRPAAMPEECTTSALGPCARCNVEIPNVKEMHILRRYNLPKIVVHNNSDDGDVILETHV